MYRIPNNSLLLPGAQKAFNIGENIEMIMIMEKTAREMYAKTAKKSCKKQGVPIAGFLEWGGSIITSAFYFRKRVQGLEFNGIIILSFTFRCPVRGC